MKLRKAVKQIIALGTGATMLGATLFGAMAANLANYPSPLFVQNGVFNGIIVVGDTAAASDVIGAVDIATSLQFEAKESVPITSSGTSATTVVMGDAAKVSKSSDALNLNEQLNDIKDTMTSDELKALADGTIRNQKGTFTYNQYIDLANDSMVTYDIDSDQSDDPNAYLEFPQDQLAYMYKVTFPTSLETDIDSSDNSLDDLDNKKMSLLGKEYTILNSELDGNDLTLNLMGGAVQDTMEEYTTKTYTINGVDYEVEVIAISTDSVILKINGEVTDKLLETDTYTLDDGTEVGIKTILENEGTETGGADIVEFYLGASKIELSENTYTGDNWNSIDVGEDTMDAQVNFEGSNTSDTLKISEIQVRWLPSDDYNVPLGGKLSDQLDADEMGNLFMNNIDYEFASLDRGTTEDIKLLPSSRNLKMTLTTKTGGEFSFDAFYIGSTGSAVYLGDEASKPLIVNSSNAFGKNAYFVLSSDDFTHLMQVNRFDDSDNQVWFKDIASGDISKVSAGNCDAAALATPASELILDGKTYTFGADCSAESLKFTGFGNDETAGSATLITKAGAKVVLQLDGADDGSVRVLEEERDDLGGGDYTTGVNVTISQYSTEDELQVASIDDVGSAGLDMQAWDSKDDYEDGWTDYGTYISYDTADNGKMTIEYPSQEMEASVYVTSGTTTTNSVSGSSGGELSSTTVNAIPVGTAKLASEVSNVASQNMIVVGGPCANSVAATLMNRAQTWPACGEGFEEGKALIKLYENGDKVAMLVAGATALDTRRASRVLADYGAYSLSGDEMQVVGTSTTFSDTVVSAVTPAAETTPVAEETTPAADTTATE